MKERRLENSLYQEQYQGTSVQWGGEQVFILILIWTTTVAPLVARLESTNTTSAGVSVDFGAYSYSWTLVWVHDIILIQPAALQN